MTNSDRIAALATQAWDVAMAASPLFATSIGDHRFDDRLPPVTAPDRAAVIGRLDGLQGEASDLASDTAAGAAGDPSDAVTAGALDAFIRLEIALRRSGVDAWAVDPLDGPQVAFLSLPDYHLVATPSDGEAMVARWAGMGDWIDAHAANIRDHRARGVVSPASPVRRVIDQLDDLLGRPDDDWPLLGPLAVDRPDWSEAELSRFGDGLRAAVRDRVRPAFTRYRAFLANELLPGARSDDQPGLAAVPGGVEAYADLVRGHTSLSLSPEAIHHIGLEEIARIDAELEALASRVLGTADRAEAQRRLRSDPVLHFETSDQILETARTSLDRANGAIADWFGILPQAPCEVVEMARHEAAHSTIAYYRDPAADGSRPGQYYVNTSSPETRPRYEAEALAFHESVPGHHLQLAIGQERTGLPAFRRFAVFTAYVEGWGLYTERLAGEMGLYSGDLDRLGVLSFDGWRASRLVVDTGMHALGWSRARAIEFMTEHTALADNNIANEVDRYISIPGQALAYKLGQLELLRLRAAARDRLGPAFDIKAYHDAVLRESALPLPVLADVVDRWSGTPRS